MNIHSYGSVLTGVMVEADEELVLVRDEESALLETGVAAIVDEAESDSEEDSLA